MLSIYLSLIESQEDKEKFEQLYYAYRKLMKYIAQGILRDEYLAEDAVHNAFIKLTKYINKFGDIFCHKTKSFIVIVIESVSKDMYRKRKKEYAESFDDHVESFVTAAPDFLNLDLEIIISVINELPDIYREVMLLKYLHEYNDKEIGDLLEISSSTVRKRLERARKIIADILKVEN